MNFGKIGPYFKTIVWQKKNATNLFKEKTVNGETIKLYRIPKGKDSYTLIGYRGSNGLEPYRQVDVTALRFKPQLEFYRLIDILKNYTCKYVQTTDLKTGKPLFYSTAIDGSYFEHNGLIHYDDIRKLNLKIDKNRPARFLAIERPEVRLPLNDGCGHPLRMTVSKVPTDKGLFVQTSEHFVTTKGKLYYTKNPQKTIADRIKLYLDNQLVQEYLSPIDMMGSRSI